MCVCQVASVVSDSMRTYGLKTFRFLCPWDSLGKNNGVGCPALLQGIFLTQVLNPHLSSLPALEDGFFTTWATWETRTYPCVCIYMYMFLCVCTYKHYT